MVSKRVNCQAGERKKTETRRTLLGVEDRPIDSSGLLAAARVQGAPAQLAVHAGQLRGLDSHGVAHDGAALRKQLQLGHGTAAGGGGGSVDGRTGGGGQSPQGARRGLLHEGAHGLGLPENSIHDGNFLSADADSL